MTRRPSIAPPSPPRATGRPPLSTLPEIVSLLGAAPPEVEVARVRTERVAVVAAFPTGVVARLAADPRSPVTTYRVLDDVPATDGALVVVIAEDVSDRDGDGALRRLRVRAPAAKLVFLAGRHDEAKSRSLAAWGAVLPPNADIDRLDRAIRHAAAISTMSAEMRRIKESSHFRAPPAPPPDSDEP
jgi:DNA-binding NarL/FixJ family response regulator